MGLAEEEVLIRDDSGLLLDVGETRVPKSQEWSKKLMKTCCLSLGFLALGLCVSIPGPTLLDLEDQVKATTFQMMVIFVSRSIGYLLGALLGGVLFDCFDKQLLMFCTLLLASVATVAIPWSLTMVVMATMFALQGVTMGALDTGGNVFCIQLWGKKNPPFMQTLHFAFGIGAFVAPLLAKPFLSHVDMQRNATSIVQGNIPVAPFLTNNLHANITLRSLDSLQSEFNRPVRDFFESPNRLKQKQKRDTFSESGSLKIGESFQYLQPHGGLSEELPDRLKRDSGNDGDENTGMWRWKRQHQLSRRQVTGQNESGPNAGTTTTTSSNINTKQVDNLIAEKANETEKLGTESTKGDTGSPENSEENKVKETDKLVQVSDTDVKSSTDKTITQNANISVASKVKSNVTVTINGTDSNTSTSVTTLLTTPPTTTEVKSEEQVHKPSAATDSNRKPDTADGKPIAKHLDEHKIPVPVNEDEDNENAPSTTKKELTSTKLPDLDKDKTVNESAVVGNHTSTDQINATSGNNSGEANITQASSETNTFNTSNHESVTRLPSTMSTLKQNEVSGPTIKKETESLGPQSNMKLNTTTAKPATTSSTKKLRTTTLPTTTTTTTEKTTTTKKATTTTIKATTTTSEKTTTEKITTTSEKVKTTMKLTPAPTSTVKATEPSTRKITPATKQPTKLKTVQPDVKITPTPEIFSTNSTVNALSITNASIPNDKLSTTEVSKKPQSAVDSFLNNAIHAVKNISRIQFAYLSIGIALFLTAILFLVLYCTDKRRLTPDRDFDELERFKASVTCSKASLIFLLGVFFFCYMGLEVTFGALVTTFAVDFNKWPKEQGAMAAAIFWGSLATGRGLSIFFSRCCGPTVMLVFDMIFMIIGGLVLSIGIHFYDKLLWLGTLILGLGMSSAFPAGISWAQKYFHLTGKSTAVFVIGSALGQMIVPVITGYFYEYKGSIILMYTTLALSIMILVIFILMQCVARKKGVTLKVNERNGFLPLEDVDDENDETLEMDDLIHFDKSQARKRRDKRGGGDAEYHTLISDLDDD